MPIVRLQLNAVQSPCNECNHHKAGLAKCCDKCENCKKRIAYNDFIDGIMDGPDPSMFEKGQHLIISKNRYENKNSLLLPPQDDTIEPKKINLKQIGRPEKIDWADLKREYIKKVVPKKMKLKELAEIFGVTVRHLRRKRKSENWPERKNPECDEKNCHGVVIAKDKCSRCYHRILYQKKKKRITLQK